MLSPAVDNPLRDRLAVVLTGTVIVAFLVMNILFAPRVLGPQQHFLVFLLGIGLGIGQVNLIAIWTALAPGNVVQRFSWSLLLIAWSGYAFVIGQRWGHPGTVDLDLTFGAGILGCALFIAFATSQVPLWLAGKVFRWRLVLRSLDQRLQFSLRNLIWAMWAIALTIAPGKFILPRGRWDLSVVLEAPRSVWVSLSAIVITNVLITIPCVWIAFTKKRSMLLVLVFWLVYCTLITGVEMGVILMLLRGMLGGPDIDSQYLAYLCAWFLNFTQFAVVFGALAVLRGVGFHFIRLPRRPKTSLENSWT